MTLITPKKGSRNSIGDHYDCYKNCTKDNIQESAIHRNSLVKMGYPSESWMLVTRGDVASELALSHQQIFDAELTDRKGKKRYLKTFFFLEQQDLQATTIIPPLTFYELTNVITAGNLSTTSRSTPATSGDSATANVLLLTKPYKNCIRSINAAIKSLITFRERESSAQHLNPGTCSSDKIEPIDICGSGGSSRTLDAFAPNFTRVSSKDAQYLSSCPQDTSSKQNTTLMRLTERRGVVAVFIGLNEFRPFIERETFEKLSDFGMKNYSCLFLGYFYFSSMNYRAFTPDEMTKFLEEHNPYTDLREEKKRSNFINFVASARNYILLLR